MNPSINYEIRSKLGSYLLEKISLEDFKDWFVPVLWDIEYSNNQDAINMAYEIELRFAEYSDDYWSEDELKQLLRPLFENYIIEPEISPRFSSTAQQNCWLIPSFSFRILYSKTL
jgi:hypothetical protein